MKKSIILIFSAIILVSLFAQDNLNIHKTNNSVESFSISTIDSLVFSNNDTQLDVYKNNSTVSNYQLSDIDSISFSNNSQIVYIDYSESDVTVTNPLASEGVIISKNGTDIVVNSTIEDTEVIYQLSGKSTNGSFKIYSMYKFDLKLNGLNLTNTTGAAINVQSTKKVTVELVAGTTNTLADGSVYETSLEDEKSTFFSEGQLVFEGTGNLNVSSVSNHAICSDDYIIINSGNITVTAAGKDGIHSKDYFKMYGGTMNITSSSDGIDCETGHFLMNDGSITINNSTANIKGISCDSTLTVTGGNINIVLSGNQSKGMKSKSLMTLGGGTIDIKNTGAIVLEPFGLGYDPSYPTAIKSESDILLSGANITINGTLAGSKGISSDTKITMTAGTIVINAAGNGTTYKNSTNTTDSYNSSCFTSDGNISILGGNLTCKNTGNGGKTISCDGTIVIGDANNSPTINLTTTGARFLVSGSDYCHPKTLVADGAITINNGNCTITSTDDGIHSGSSVTINGGNHLINANSTEKGVGEGVEAPIITFNGGVTDITASNDGINATYGTVVNGTESNDGSYLYIKGGIVIVAGADAVDSNGNIVVTGGTTIINGPSSGVEEGLDFNGSFNMNGGLLISAGSNSNMTKAMSTSSTQPGMYIKSSSIIASSSMIHIEDGSGNNLVTFKPKNGGYYYHFSSTGLTKGGSYKIYSGGSYTGGSFVGGTSGYGLYTGGTYSTSGATLKKSGTLSTSSTVNTITF